MSLTPSRCRGARALLNWPRTRLALEANVSRSLISSYELLRRKPSQNSRSAIWRAFHNAGIVVLPSHDGWDIQLSVSPMGALCRAGRALLCWTSSALAAQSSLPVRTVADFEAGKRVGPDAENQIFSALSRAGVSVLASADGVRFANTAETLRELVLLAQGRGAWDFKLSEGRDRVARHRRGMAGLYGCGCGNLSEAPYYPKAGMEELDARISGEIVRRSKACGEDEVCFFLTALRKDIAEDGYEAAKPGVPREKLLCAI